jgi:kynureninase
LEKIMVSRADCETLDRKDLFGPHRERFHIPEGLIYLDGNSLGLMPKSAPARVADAVTRQWGEDLITSWNKNGWFHLPRTIGDKVSRLIGGGVGNVMIADTISVNLFKVLTAALALKRERRVILSDSGNFPSDLYVAQGLNRFLADGHELKAVAPEEVAGAINEDVAVVMITEVDYRTARRHDMKAITKLAHERGCLTIWDLAHSAGAVPVDLLGANADFAIGCTYKYLNGGPGSQAFVWVHPRHQASAEPALVGWWGHARPFAFDLNWEPAAGLVRQQCGTQAILSMVALDAAMDEWADVDLQALRRKSQGLCKLFIDLVEVNCGKHGLGLAGPRDMAQRGSHVSFHCPEGYAVMQALIARGVIGDFRAPDIIRFGFAPLYNSHVEVFDAAAALTEILDARSWDRPEFLAKKAVT